MDDKKELADATHEGFVIICKICGDNTVTVDSDVGFSTISGAWGGVQLKCLTCGNETEIFTM